MKATKDLLTRLRGISGQLRELAENPERHELDVDAIVDLNLARESVDKLIHRVERILE
jgi:DNA-binding FrmR family transcriptional regulator